MDLCKFASVELGVTAITYKDLEITAFMVMPSCSYQVRLMVIETLAKDYLNNNILSFDEYRNS